MLFYLQYRQSIGFCQIIYMPNNARRAQAAVNIHICVWNEFGNFVSRLPSAYVEDFFSLDRETNTLGTASHRNTKYKFTLIADNTINQ